jgi:hypothetical protein
MTKEPKPDTQNGRLLAFLRTGKTIHPLRAWRELGIYRLGGRIHDLRKAGFNIVDERKPVFNRFGEECRVAHYKLEKTA